MSAGKPILLTGYDAKRCARRVHNEWDPAIGKVAWEIPEDLQMRFNTGIECEAGVFAQHRSRVDDPSVEGSLWGELPKALRTCPELAQESCGGIGPTTIYRTSR